VRILLASIHANLRVADAAATTLGECQAHLLFERTFTINQSPKFTR